MKRLPHLMLIALLLLVVAGAIPGLSAASLSGNDVDGPLPTADPEPIASTCGYSAGGEENAEADAENNANQYCIALGCKGAIITTTHPSWVDKAGYTHVCVTFACDC